MSAPKRVLVEGSHISKIYGTGEGQTLALDDVSFRIYEGELLCLLGSSGSGKSTLLNILGGMDKANNGSLHVMGKDICRMGDLGLTRYRRNVIGFVFQSFNLIPELTARENVSLVNPNPSAVRAALEAVGMEKRMNRYPSQLSGGQQQRVSIARALVRHPRLLLCDEPTGALDYATGRQILQELERTCREMGTTVVLVTHTREIGKMADRVLTMRSGRLVSETVNENPISAKDIEW